MHEARPSRTALRVAIRRAAHQWLDAPHVLDDPIALAIIGADNVASMKAAPDIQQERPQQSLRALIVARSRFAEDELARAIAAATGRRDSSPASPAPEVRPAPAMQYVVLGAGLDTFAWRNPYPASVLRVPLSELRRALVVAISSESVENMSPAA